MLITKITLHNWKSYASATVEFTPGANAIIGQNGAGKSSILEAIGYVVFNARPDGFTNATMLREDAKSGSVVVSLVAPKDKRHYDIERRFNGNTSTRYQVTDPDLGSAVVANGASEVRQWVVTNLDLGDGTKPDQLFSQTLGVPQGMITNAFALAAGERKRIFDPLLRVDEYRRASDALRPARRQLEDRSHALDTQLANIEGQLERHPGLLQELTDIENSVAEDEIQAASLAEALAATQAQVEDLDARQASLRAAETAALQAKNLRGMQAQSLETTQNDLAASAEARSQVAAAETGHLSYLAAQERLNTLDQDRQRRDALLRDQASAQNRHARLDAALQQIAQRLNEIATAEAEMARLEPLVSQQETLDQQLAEIRQAQVSLRNTRQEHERLSRQHQQRATDLAALRHSFAQTDEVRAEIESLETSLAASDEQQNAMRVRGMACKAEQERLEEQTRVLQETTSAKCPVCEAELTAQHREELVARNLCEIERLKQQRDATRQELVAAMESAKRIKQQRAEAHARQIVLPQQADVARQEELVVQAQQELDDRQRVIIEHEQQIAGLAGLQQALAELGDPRAERAGHQATASRRGAIQHSLATSQAELTQVEAELAQLEGALAPLADLENEITATRAERDHHADDHNTYLTQAASAQRYDALLEQTTRLEASLAAADTELEAKQAALTRAQSEYDEQAHVEAREQRQIAGQLQAAATERLTANKRRLAALRQELAEITELERKQVDCETEREAVSRHLAVLHFVRQTLTAAGPHITERKVQNISLRASELFGDIMEDHRGRLRWDRDYQLTLDVGGHERGFRQLSGGEEMTAALALRLALLQETSDLKLAFLDEPTAHMDESRRDVLAARILDVQGFDQLFVISHDDTFETLANNFVHIIKDDDGSHLETDPDRAPATTMTTAEA